MVTCNQRSRVVLLLGLVMTLAFVPACQSTGRLHNAGGGQSTPIVTPHQAYRPPYYGEVPQRQYFIGGYAGHNYGQGPRAGYAPTGYWAQPPAATRPGLLGWLTDH
jgi:hypothetical protein